MCGGLPAPLLLLLALCLATAAPRAWLLASPQPAAVWMRELVSPAADLNLEKLVGRWFVVEEVAPVRLSSDSTCDWYDFWRDENGTLTVQWFVRAEDRTEAVVPAIPVMDGGVWHLPGQHSARCDSACEDAHEQEAAHWPAHAPGGVDDAVLPAAAEPQGGGVRLQLARVRHPVGSICLIAHACQPRQVAYVSPDEGPLWMLVCAKHASNCTLLPLSRAVAHADGFGDPEASQQQRRVVVQLDLLAVGRPQLPTSGLNAEAGHLHCHF